MEKPEWSPQEWLSREMSLITQSQKDPALFGELYSRNFEKVFRFVYHRTAEKQTAKDITQQVFLKALLNLKNYTFRGFPFSSWLFRIAINELNKFYGKTERERCLNIESNGLADLLSEMDSNDYAEYDEALAIALQQLSEENIQLIDMRYFEKRSFAEIGEILGLTENNAKVRLYRAIDKLKILFQYK